jgi:hypothetical protein
MLCISSLYPVLGYGHSEKLYNTNNLLVLHTTSYGKKIYSFLLSNFLCKEKSNSNI